MNAEFTKLNNNLTYISTIVKELNIGLHALLLLNDSDELSDYINDKQTLIDCNQKLKDLKEKLENKQEDVIYELTNKQSACNHKFNNMGITPYHDVYECEICGYMDYR